VWLSYTRRKGKKPTTSRFFGRCKEKKSHRSALSRIKAWDPACVFFTTTGAEK